MPDAFDRLADAQAVQQGRLTDRTLAQLARLWNAVPNHADPEQVAVFAARASTVVRTAELATGQLTESYLREALRQLGITVPVARLVDLPASLRGEDIDPVEVFTRPAATVRYLLSTDTPRPQAVREGLARLNAIAASNLQLALRQSTVDSFSRTPSVRYRRILRPYLSRGGSCGLCVSAANRVYRRGDLMPIHAHCKCAVMPITAAGDPGLDLNRADLDQLYRQAGGSTDGDRLKGTRYQVQIHGELGPVLVPAGQALRTEEQARRDTRRTRRRTGRDVPAAAGASRPVAGRRDAAAARAALADFQTNLPSLLERAEAGEDVAAAIAYHRGQIAFISRALATAAA